MATPEPDPDLVALLDDPDVVEALRAIGRRERLRPRPLCPRCGRRSIALNPEGWCAACAEEERDRQRRRRQSKRRWWQDNGRAWRAAAARAQEEDNEK